MNFEEVRADTLRLVMTFGDELRSLLRYILLCNLSTPLMEE